MNRLQFWKQNKETIDKIVREINITSNSEINDYIIERIDQIASKYRYDISIEELRKKTKRIKVDFSLSASENRKKLNKPLEVSDSNVVDIVNQYKIEISKYPILTPQEEYDLFKRYSDGEKELRNKLYVSNLRLVATIASSYTNKGVEYLDLVQEGNIGLLKAIDKFNVDLGNKFSTCATPWIKQAITRSIPDSTNPYHIPDHASLTLAKIAKINNRYNQELGRDATIEELASETKKPIESIRLILKRSESPMSLYKKVGEKEDTELHQILPANEGATTEDISMYNSLRENLFEIMDVLNDREKETIIKRFGMDNGGNGLLQEELAKKFNVTKQRVQQLEKGALKKLYIAAKKKQLYNYLEQ